jgi:predicted O-methyltransferase YrrM
LRKEYQQDAAIVQGDDFGAGSRVAGAVQNRSIASIARYGISSKRECRFLQSIVMLLKPKTCLELGTSLGISTAYLASAVPNGIVYTFEGNATLCQIARKNWQSLGIENIALFQGNIDLLLKSKLEELPPLDFVVIDANHTKEALWHYYDTVAQHMSEGAAIYIDDIRWSWRMYEGWKKIVRSDRMTLSIEFMNSGLLIFKSGIPRQHYVLSY